MNTLYNYFRLFLLISVMFSGASCHKEEQELVLAASAQQQGTAHTELAFPGKAGIEKTGTLFGTAIHYQEIEGHAVFEGDIVLTADQLRKTPTERTTGAAVSKGGLLWPGGIVYYTIDPSISSSDIIKSAMTEIENKTSLQFIPGQGKSDYVTFRVGPGNSSSIGMIGGQQYITLSQPITYGAVLHEIGHAIGLFHEHTRSDRDETININLNNVDPVWHSQFNRYAQQGYQGQDFGTMDLGSMMMLDAFSFSSNGKPTMTRKNGIIFRTQREKLSEQDVACINSLYATVYVINNNKLYAADTLEGNRVELPGNWTGAKYMTVGAKHLFVVQDGYIKMLNRLSGKHVFSFGKFDNITGMTMKTLEFLFVLQDGYLRRIDTRNRTMITLGERSFQNTKWLTFMAPNLYALGQSGNIMEVNEYSGLITGNVPGTSPNCTKIGPFSYQSLYVVEGSNVSIIDRYKHTKTLLSNAYVPGRPITSNRLAVFMPYSTTNQLCRVNQSGTKYVKQIWDNLQLIGMRDPSVTLTMYE